MASECRWSGLHAALTSHPQFDCLARLVELFEGSENRHKVIVSRQVRVIPYLDLGVARQLLAVGSGVLEVENVYEHALDVHPVRLGETKVASDPPASQPFRQRARGRGRRSGGVEVVGRLERSRSNPMHKSPLVSSRLFWGGRRLSDALPSKQP